MYKRKKIVAVILARGRSKGIPRKNIIDLCGKPLIYYSIKHALDCKLIDRVIVSTEDKKIGMVARRYGAEVFKRPKYLAQNKSSTEDVLLHLLNILDKENYNVDYLLLLQPTSPIRYSSTINNTIKNISNPNTNLVITVREGRGFYWIKDKKGFRTLFKVQSRRRQERIPLYQENSCVYLIKTESLKNNGLVPKDNNTIAFYEISEEESVDIDTLSDLEYARFLITNKGGFYGNNKIRK